MGRGLRDNFPSIETSLREIDKTLGYEISAALDGPAERLFPPLHTPEPSVFIEATAALSLAVARSLADAAAPPSVLAGRSMGEYAAGAFAGAFGTADCFRMLRAVGVLAQQDCIETPSLLVTIYGPSREQLYSLAQKMKASGIFCEIVIFYDKARLGVAAIEASGLEPLKDHLAGFSHRLTISKEHGAFHSTLFSRLAGRAAGAFSGMDFTPPSLPLYMNLDGKQEADPGAVRTKLAAGLNNPVLWQETISAMLADGVRTFVEIAPGAMLTDFICNVPPDAEILRTDTPENYLRTLERLKPNEHG